MKKIILTALFLTTLFGIAQPVINVSNIISINQSFNRFSTSPSSLGVGSSGANQNWDFSGLILTQQGTIITNSVVNTAPYVSFFSNANFFLQTTSGIDTSFGYYNLNPNLFEALGSSFSSGTFFTLTNPSTIFTLPFLFNDSFSDTYQSSSSPLQSRTVTYDSYGTLSTAFGSYNNVIRIKQVGNGSTAYSWFLINPYQDIANAIINNDGSTSFFINEQLSLSTTQNEVKQFAVYPNPTSGNINIKNIDFSNKSMFVKVYNMLGNAIINNYKLETESANIDLSNYATGLYFIEIADENNKVIYQDKVIRK